MEMLQQIRRLENEQRKTIVEIQSFKRHQSTKRSRLIVPENPIEQIISRVDAPKTNLVNVDGLRINKVSTEVNSYGLFSVEIELSNGDIVKAGSKPGAKVESYDVS